MSPNFVPALSSLSAWPGLLASLLFCASVGAQQQPAPQNIVQLQASGSVEVQQDLLSISLNTTKEGPDAATRHRPCVSSRSSRD